MAGKGNGKVKILGFAGSLRKGSFNKMLLRAAVEVAPEEVELEVFDLEGIPPFNQDLENMPHEKLKEFKSKIKAADGLLIVTPEYNYSVPGVLKNAIDAASRPYRALLKKNPLRSWVLQSECSVRPGPSII